MMQGQQGGKAYIRRNKGKEEMRRLRQMVLFSLWICRKIMMKRKGTWFEMPRGAELSKGSGFVVHEDRLEERMPYIGGGK